MGYLKPKMKPRANRYVLTILSLALFVVLGGWTFSHWNDEGYFTAVNFKAGTVIVTFLFVCSLEMIWKPSNAGKG